MVNNHLGYVNDIKTRITSLFEKFIKDKKYQTYLR